MRVLSAERPNGIVVAGPVQYIANGGVQGAPAHRNIVERNGYYYFMLDCAFLHIIDKQQRKNKCVYRTRNISDPSSWKGWNGDSYAVPVFDPYTQAAPSNSSIKKLLPAPVNTSLSGSLVWLREVGEWVIVGTTFNENKFGQVYYQSSKDLLHWSEAVLLLNLSHTPAIRDGKGALYPSIVDPSSSRRNFDDFGTDGYIFWTEFSCPSTGECWERNVVRRTLRLVKSA